MVAGVAGGGHPADVEAYFAPADRELEFPTDLCELRDHPRHPRRSGRHHHPERPQALNALNSQVMNEVTTAAAEFDNDPGIGAIVITGNEKAFAAGADIKEMSSLSFADVFAADFFAPWAKFAATRTPPSPPSPDTRWAAAASWR